MLRALFLSFKHSLERTIFDEMIAIDALVEIGDSAKDFLLTTLKSRPLTQDNSHAAFALGGFAHHPQVALACFDKWNIWQVQDKPLLRAYLINNCKTLKPRLSTAINLSKWQPILLLLPTCALKCKPSSPSGIPNKSCHYFSACACVHQSRKCL